MRIGIWTTVFIFSFSNWAKAGPTPTLTLSEFLNRIQSESPDLRIEKSLNSEAAAKADGVRIPPPMIGLMQMRDAGGTNNGVEISQEIPFPAKILKEKKVRRLEAEAQKANLAFRKNEILSSARIAYFEFWSAYERNVLIREKRDWLNKHLKLARSTTRSDSTAQLHLLEIESEVDLLGNELLDSETILQQKRNALKSFIPDMNFDQIEPKASPFQKLKITETAPRTKIQLKESELKTAEAQKDLSSQNYWPDLFIRYRGYKGNEMTPKSEETMVGISLPFIFFSEPRAESQAANARYQRAQAELQKAQIETKSSIDSLITKIQSLEKQLLNLDSSLLPRAQKRMRLVANLSPRSMEGLEEHRRVMLSYLDIRLKAIETRLELEKSVGELMTLFSNEGVQQ